MGYWKVRLYALVLVVICAGLVYYNWQQLMSKSSYDIKLAAFGPVGVVGGLYLLLFPTKIGRPETTLDKMLAMIVFGVGLAAGLYNWYLMDPGFFSFINR